jgi:hypothetical protein
LADAGVKVDEKRPPDSEKAATIYYDARRWRRRHARFSEIDRHRRDFTTVRNLPKEARGAGFSDDYRRPWCIHAVGRVP